MKKNLLCFIAFYLNLFLVAQQAPLEKNYPFGLGENLSYNAYWSIFKIAEMNSVVDTSSQFVGGKPCYKVDVTANMATMVRMFAAIDEIFGAYIDTATLLPTTSYRYLKEAKYTHDEVSYYDYEKGKMQLTVFNKNAERFETKDSFYIHKKTFDVVSGYMNLRNTNFKKMKQGDMVTVNMFIENDLYPITFTIAAFEKIKVKAGKFNTIKLDLSIPNNKVINKDHPLYVWLSADDNKMIVKAEAKLSFGKASLELKNYKGTKHPVARN